MVPAEDGVGRYDGGNVGKDPPTEDPALSCEPPPLVIGETQASPAELLFQHSILFNEVLDDLGLVAIYPSGEGGEEELEREEIGHVTGIIDSMDSSRKHRVRSAI